MDAKELIRATVAGQGEQPGWNSPAAQYQPMMRAIARMRHPNAEARRPTTAEAVAVRTEFDHGSGVRS
jgi:hypothetical protein